MNKQLQIGNFIIDGNVVLGPMAGVTDMPYRALCKEQGASFTYTEMISAKALQYKNKNTIPLMQVSATEGQAALQLFGSDPEVMAQEAARLEEGPYAFFDINMGCPVPKIVGNGEGSALMLQPRRAGEIVSAMKKRLHKPVTVKFRKGFDAQHINAVEFAKMLQDCGADALAVHGRTREEYYSGKADWDVIGEVKAAVDIPVIGSGDIYSGADAANLLAKSGCDGVMVARGARGNPWIFSRINEYFKTGKESPGPDISELCSMILRHCCMLIEFSGEDMAIRQMRKHVGWYSAGYPASASLRREINSAATYGEFRDILTKWHENLQKGQLNDQF